MLLLLYHKLYKMSNYVNKNDMKGRNKMEKYFNEALIGNKEILVTYTRQGEIQRMYYPAKDNRQYISFYHTGVKVNDSDLVYLHNDINNSYNQYYDVNTNILNTEINNTYFNCLNFAMSRSRLSLQISFQ